MLCPDRVSYLAGCGVKPDGRKQPRPVPRTQPRRVALGIVGQHTAADDVGERGDSRPGSGRRRDAQRQRRRRGAIRKDTSHKFDAAGRLRSMRATLERELTDRPGERLAGFPHVGPTGYGSDRQEGVRNGWNDAQHGRGCWWHGHRAGMGDPSTEPRSAEQGYSRSDRAARDRNCPLGPIRDWQ